MPICTPYLADPLFGFAAAHDGKNDQEGRLHEERPEVGAWFANPGKREQFEEATQWHKSRIAEGGFETIVQFPEDSLSKNALDKSDRHQNNVVAERSSAVAGPKRLSDLAARGAAPSEP